MLYFCSCQGTHQDTVLICTENTFEGSSQSLFCHPFLNLTSSENTAAQMMHRIDPQDHGVQPTKQQAVCSKYFMPWPHQAAVVCTAPPVLFKIITAFFSPHVQFGFVCKACIKPSSLLLSLPPNSPVQPTRRVMSHHSQDSNLESRNPWFRRLLLIHQATCSSPLL